MKFLVPWFNFGLQGAISRFINIRKYMKPHNVSVDFCSLINNTDCPFPTMPKILTFSQAKEVKWDGILIPGAGAGQLMNYFTKLQHPNFGKRYQFILTSPQLRNRFVKCNEYVRPEILIINNRHWGPWQVKFRYGKTAYIIPGAVDIHIFAPADRNKNDKITVGGFFTKNPQPLIDSSKFLPDNYVIKFWGGQAQTVSKKIYTVGKLFGQELADYYNSLDMFVTTERHAGWCNPAAEAMSCGVPVICSQWGTNSFAYDDHTALVLKDNEITGKEIANRILLIGEDEERKLGRTLGSAGSTYIRKNYSWEVYCKKLYNILIREGE